MKISNLILASFLALTIFSPKAFSAAKGNEGSGGGDICENRIKNIRDDLQVWIKNGGPNNLKFSEGVSASQYTYAMLDQIERAKVKCVGKGDVGYPVSVNGTPKVCRFDLADEGKITCDFTKFQATSESDQYVLIHHEYAGLAKLENPNGDDSTYALSNQISKYLVSTIVKKLSVKVVDNSKFDESLHLNFLPINSKITFPVDTVILPGETWVQLPDLKLGAENANCRVEVKYSSSIRKIKGVITTTTPVLPAKASISVDSTKLDLKYVDIARIICGKRSHNGSEFLSIKEFRQYLESLGGSLEIAPTVDF